MELWTRIREAATWSCTCESDGECGLHGIMECKHGEPFHYHHDGCPACVQDDTFSEDEEIVSALTWAKLKRERGEKCIPYEVQ